MHSGQDELAGIY